MTMSDEILILAPTEELADLVAARRPKEALRLYQVTADFYIEEGRTATGSGEGLAAMADLARVQQKLEKVQKRLPS